MTPLEDRLYLALLGAAPVVRAQANVNPATIRVATLVDQTLAAYKAAQAAEKPAEETADADRE